MEELPKRLSKYRVTSRKTTTPSPGMEVITGSGELRVMARPVSRTGGVSNYLFGLEAIDAAQVAVLALDADVEDAGDENGPIHVNLHSRDLNDGADPLVGIGWH